VYEVNTFISEEEIVVDALPQYDGNGLDFTGSLSDCDDNYSGNNLECVVEERMRANLRVDFAADKWKNDIFARLGIVVPNDIRRYLTQVFIDVHEETTVGLTTTKHTFAMPILNKTGPTTYTTAPGVALDFSVADQATFRYEFRNRYEAHLSNLYTYVNGVLLTSPTSTMNWAGRTIRLEWNLVFFYDDYTTPFSDTIKYTQIVRPKDYEIDSFYIQEKDSDFSGKGDAIEWPDFECTEDGMCYQARITNDSSGYKLITIIESNPGNATVTLEEREEWVPDVLPQLTTNKYYNQESDFGQTTADVAKFCVDASKISLNLPYKISAIAKQVIPENGRILSDGIDRDLSDGTQRFIS